MDGLETGVEGRAEMVVGSNDTALRVGSGKSPVLATPVMVSLMEEAALDAVEAALPEGMQSLGTRLDISHVAATPVGMKVRATAQLVEIRDRRLVFAVRAEDETDLIGEGTHERVVVKVEAFVGRVQAKAAKK